ncbi:hypothetical protein PVL29_009449 [Vitis rotundifolia]|uniref:snRNA-activating protein complex subunit n=1 Tax=Vitis rotundifolia TaxID=103349 RepID=A0AA39DVH2_VITRO|nr:hypothetical protein PVL29_009449 [Vitis rotundifolia]
MEIVECGLEDEDSYVSVPRGGPIYVPDFVGPITRVPEFLTSVVQHLQDLEAEISQAHDEVLSVDELKIFTEEELVDKAFKEAFKDSEGAQNSSQLSDENSNAGGERDCRNSNKRKRREIIDRNDFSVEDSYTAKVQQLAEIKHKQDEDKAAARLHSFDGSCKINECALPSSEKIERMKYLRSISSVTKVKSSNIHGHVMEHYEDAVLCIEIYHSRKTWVKAQEFLVLGRQTLTELRDNICCATDQVMQKAGKHDPSGYILIEDVFCNDLRDPSAIDYSKPIFDWLRNSKDDALEKWECIISGELQQKQKALLGDPTISRLPHFKAVDMHKTRFCDLQFRLGAGYLYCHQGDCRHTIVIRDMRLFHPEDVGDRAAYPILTFQLKSRVQKCCVCKIYRATKVTVDDKWAPENPCYFCDNCYFLLHYSEDGSLLYKEFSVYDYHHE